MRMGAADTGAVRLMRVSALTVRLAADTAGAGWVAEEMEAVRAVGFFSWAVEMSSELTTRVVGLAFHLVLRRRRFTHHPHGTHSHGVGPVRRVIRGGMRVITSSRAGMAGVRGLGRRGIMGVDRCLEWSAASDRSWVLSYSYSLQITPKKPKSHI